MDPDINLQIFFILLEIHTLLIPRDAWSHSEKYNKLNKLIMILIKIKDMKFLIFIYFSCNNIRYSGLNASRIILYTPFLQRNEIDSLQS